MVSLLEEAAHCPVCDNVPFPHEEEVLGQKRVFLKCRKGHPYVICGDTLSQAIMNWNEYISMHNQRSMAMRSQQVAKNLGLSFCPHCQVYTESHTEVNKIFSPDMRLGYAVVTEQCKECHLIKSQKDA